MENLNYMNDNPKGYLNEMYQSGKISQFNIEVKPVIVENALKFKAWVHVTRGRTIYTTTSEPNSIKKVAEREACLDVAKKMLNPTVNWSEVYAWLNGQIALVEPHLAATLAEFCEARIDTFAEEFEDLKMFARIQANGFSINADEATGRLAELWNALMHALNGNGSLSDFEENQSLEDVEEACSECESKDVVIETLFKVFQVLKLEHVGPSVTVCQEGDDKIKALLQQVAPANELPDEANIHVAKPLNPPSIERLQKQTRINPEASAIRKPALNEDGYSATLARLRNKAMHAYNGNPPKAHIRKVVEEKKVITNKRFPKPGYQPKSKRTVAFKKSNTKPRARKEKATTKASFKKQVFSNSLSREIATICAPGALPTVRFADAYADKMTAVAAPFKTLDLEFGAPSSGSQGLPDGQGICMLFRDPMRNVVRYLPNASAQLSRYKAVFVPNKWSSGNGYFRHPKTGNNWIPLPFAHFVPSPSYDWTPHGDVLGVGISSAKPSGYVYIPANYDVSIVFAGELAIGAKVELRVTKWGGLKKEAEHQLVSISTPFLHDWTNDMGEGYYAFDFRVVLNGDDDLALFIECQGMTIHGDGSLYGHTTLPFLDQKIASVQKMRILGASLMMSNDSPELYKNGTITMCQMSGEIPWQRIMLGGLSKFQEQNQRVIMPSKNGMFGFLRPTSDEDFDFICNDSDDYSTTDFPKFYFDLESPRDFLVLWWSMDASETKVARYTVSNAVEFNTQDSWFTVAMPSMQPALFQKAVELTKRVPQYHENPLHLKDVLGTAKRLAKQITEGAVRYGPTLIKIFEQYGPKILQTLESLSVEEAAEGAALAVL